jgi:hypothetical protein
MPDGVVTYVRAALAGLAVLLVLAFSGGLARSRVPHLASVLGVAFVQALNVVGHGAGEPCRDHGTTSDPGCCASVHGPADAALIPRTALEVRPRTPALAEYPLMATPRADGFLLSPIVPPPRAES